MNDIQKINMFLDNYSKNVDRVLNESLEKEANLLLTESRLLVPVQSGELRDESDVKKEKEFEFHVRYNMDYAAYIHEDLERYHPIGQAKFLETVTTKEARNIPRRIANDLSKVKG